MAEHDDRLTQALSEFVRRETKQPPEADPPVRWPAVLFLTLLAIDLAVLLSFLQTLAKEEWVTLLSRTAPFVLGTILLAKLDEYRPRLVRTSSSLLFRSVVVVAAIVLFTCYYVLPSQELRVPVRMDRSLGLSVNGVVQTVESPGDDPTVPYVGTVRIPFSGFHTQQVTVTGSVPGLGHLMMPVQDVYDIGFLERLRAALALQNGGSYVLELPSTYPTTVVFDSVRDSVRVTLTVSGHFPQRFLDRVASARKDLHLVRFDRRTDAAVADSFSTDSASIRFPVSDAAAPLRILLPRGLYEIATTFDGARVVCSEQVVARQQRLTVTPRQCSGS